MISSLALERWLDPLPDAWFASSSCMNGLFLGLALLSWAMAEALMAPILQSKLALLVVFYSACFFLFVGWYFRVSRLFASPWISYKTALGPMVWTLMPLHLVLPASLILFHFGFGGIVLYEVMKVTVLLLVVSRMSDVFQRLNQWPRWAAVALTLSPLAVALAGMVFVFFLGGLSVLALGLGALKS